MKLFLSLFLVAAGIWSNCLAQTSPIFETNGKAIKGFDVIAFHLDGKPRPGNDQFAYKWNDATWLFASQAHLDSFKVAPEKYVPQYGGYCAYGVSQGHKAPTEIDTWTLLDGKLYFNYNQKVKQLWTKSTAHYISLADKAWVEIEDKE